MDGVQPPKYIHEKQHWPNFRWHTDAIANKVANVRHLQGRFIGKMLSVGFQLRSDASLEALTEDVQKSSEIEGEFLDRDEVRSSVARHLGMNIGALAPFDRDVEGVVEMMVDATHQFELPLTASRLFGWHSALFPTGDSGLRTITRGAWRNDSHGPMQVFSGPIGRERVHFQAPDAARLGTEMDRFLHWFEGQAAIDPVLKSAVAHLWFVTIHPFDDGNGRIARAISDLALARSERINQRFYSMSSQIRKEQQTYYNILEETQKGDLDITKWLNWFLDCLERAIISADSTFDSTLAKRRFWDKLRSVSLNERQRLMLNMLMDGFEGKLTTLKWSKITKASHDTALRDIQDLIVKNVLVKESAGGRSVNYLVSPNKLQDSNQ